MLRRVMELVVSVVLWRSAGHVSWVGRRERVRYLGCCITTLLVTEMMVMKLRYVVVDGRR